MDAMKEVSEVYDDAMIGSSLGCWGIVAFWFEVGAKVVM